MASKWEPETKQQILPEDACLFGCSARRKSGDAVTHKVPSLTFEVRAGTKITRVQRRHISQEHVCREEEYLR
jgi:hypothetical protein